MYGLRKTNWSAMPAETEDILEGLSTAAFDEIAEKVRSGSLNAKTIEGYNLTESNLRKFENTYQTLKQRLEKEKSEHRRKNLFTTSLPASFDAVEELVDAMDRLITGESRIGQTGRKISQILKPLTRPE